jgi:hypothetical protein
MLRAMLTDYRVGPYWDFVDVEFPKINPFVTGHIEDIWNTML